MALNGLDPIILFKFFELTEGRVYDAVSSVPLVGDYLANKDSGVTIPFYMSRGLTGIVVDTMSKSVDAETHIIPRLSLENGVSTPLPPLVRQLGVNSVVSINFECEKDNVMLALFLALNDMVFRSLVEQRYSISYFNGTTAIIDALFHSFSHQEIADTTLVTGTLTLSRANYESAVPLERPITARRVTAPLPAGAP